MSRRPWFANRGGAGPAKSRAAASASDAAVDAFARFYQQLIADLPDGLNSATGKEDDDDTDEERKEQTRSQSSKQAAVAAAVGEQRERVLRLFARQDSDYYSVHGDAAYFVADEYNRTRVDIKWRGAEQLPWLNLRPKKVSEVVSDAIRNKRMVVEVWQRPSGGEEWQCFRRGSAADWSELEDLVGEIDDSQLVMAVSLTLVQQQRMVGVALLDAANSRLHIAEFGDDSQLSTLESVLVQHGPRSCVCQQDKKTNNDMQRIDELLQSGSIAREESKMKGAYGEEKFLPDLARVVDDIQRYTLLVSSQPHAMAALASLITTLGLAASSNPQHKYQLLSLNLAQYCKLDHSAFTALNLFPLSSSSAAALPSLTSPSITNDLSLYSFLNKTRTTMGARLLSRYIRQPLLSVTDIRARHDVVDYFVSHPPLRSQLRDSPSCLRRCPDGEQLLRRLQRDKAKLIDVVKLYQLVVKVGRMAEALLAVGKADEHELVVQRYGAVLRECEREMEQFVCMCDRAIDMENSERNWYSGATMRAEFSPQLQQLSTRREQLRRRMEAIRVDVEQQLDLEGKVSLDYTSCHLRITNRDEHKARLSAPYQVVDSKKDGTRFTLPALRVLGSEYKTVVAMYGEMQRVYEHRLIETTLTYGVVVERLCAVIGELDVMLAFAHVAATVDGYVRPVMREAGSGVLRMERSRHPLLEQRVTGGSDGVGGEGESNGALMGSFIPNDVEMVAGESHCQIITGPNSGGKSTYIRQIGVICLMAQIGSFVPCSSAELSVVDAILCRIGASDIQHRGVSTFMSEMLDTAQIVQLATPRSLVIVDEMGRGTSTDDGYALTYATASYIARQRCFALFATHFHQLMGMEGRVDGVVNRHVTAVVDDDGGLLMRYEVTAGGCAQSFGVECMTMAKFDPQIVARARERLAEVEGEGGAEVDGSREEADDEKEEVEEEEEVRGLYEELKVRVGRLSRLGDAEREHERASIRQAGEELRGRMNRLNERRTGKRQRLQQQPDATLHVQ